LNQSPHPLFEVVTTSMGAVSIRHKLINEIMHNPVGPWREANDLYIEQSKLAQRLGDHRNAEPLILFDVGLGAAANALAVLHCYREVAKGLHCRPLKIVSFEKDLELLRFALDHADQFEHFLGYEQTLAQLLQNHQWSEGPLSWELREGDFTELIQKETEKPHIVLFDPYSPKVNREMWTLACFRLIRKVSREPDQGGTLFYTYSQATSIRAALLAAGFFVGFGKSTGLKESTTQASTILENLDSPLDARWFERWKRSGAPYPFESTEQEKRQINELFEKLEQLRPAPVVKAEKSVQDPISST